MSLRFRRLPAVLTFLFLLAGAALPALAADERTHEPGAGERPWSRSGSWSRERSRLAQEGDKSGQDPGWDESTVEILQISGPLDPPVVAAVRRLMQQAEARGSEAIVVQLDSPGGLDVDAHQVVAPVRTSRVPVVVWVGPGGARAAGAAVFLVAASHLPAAATAANIGPACPVTASVECRREDVSLLEALLRERGRSEEAMHLALERLASDTVMDASTGEGNEAFVDLVVDGLEALLVDLDGRTVVTETGSKTLQINPEQTTIRFHNLGLVRRTLHAVLDPAVVYLLLVGVLLLAAFEVFQPGFGVAGVAAILLGPLTVYGLIVLPVRWWGLGLIVIGVLALALDLAIAGLGVPTVVGAFALAIGSWQLFPAGSPLLRLSPWLIGTVVAFAGAYFVVIMTVVLRAQAGPDPGAAVEDLVGRVGMVRSALNPEGHVFVAGALWRARWVGEERGRIKAGTQVRVTGRDGTVLLVDASESPVVIQGVTRDALPPSDGTRTP
ncbi:MAG: hypothetical protein M3252_05115 [Actinomycetota bacterium]|nr:hypothetical protein [Actinomycetota bacterium]